MLSVLFAYRQRRSLRLIYCLTVLSYWNTARNEMAIKIRIFRFLPPILHEKYCMQTAMTSRAMQWLKNYIRSVKICHRISILSISALLDFTDTCIQRYRYRMYDNPHRAIYEILFGSFSLKFGDESKGKGAEVSLHSAAGRLGQLHRIQPNHSTNRTE